MAKKPKRAIKPKPVSRAVANGDKKPTRPPVKKPR